MYTVTPLAAYMQAGKGGELTHDETTIIAGALELRDKTASDAMTPISEIFSIDINAKLDRLYMHYFISTASVTFYSF